MEVQRWNAFVRSPEHAPACQRTGAPTYSYEDLRTRVAASRRAVTASGALDRDEATRCSAPGGRDKQGIGLRRHAIESGRERVKQFRQADAAT